MNDIPKIKITMLAPSNVGKTCYMLGMYARMQMGIEGFTLRAVDLDQEIELTDRWSMLTLEKGEDRWPPKNVGLGENYVFEFSYGFKPMIQFDWLDYRGGALMATSADSDRKQLQNQIVNSQGVLLCISGELLKKKVDDNSLQEIGTKSNVKMMNWNLTELSKTRKTTEIIFPVMILITKYDECYQRPREELIADVKKIFSTLFDPNTKGYFIMICPVTLGKGLAEDSNNANINPVNVELPMIFMAYTHYYGLYLEALARKQQLKGKLTNEEKKGFWDRMWNGDESDWFKGQIDINEEERKEYLSKIRLLANKLQEVDLFLNGEEVTIDEMG
ncbi:MAG: hypothetical protein WCJ03_07155 [Bacteroidales bacterium]